MHTLSTLLLLVVTALFFFMHGFAVCKIVIQGGTKAKIGEFPFMASIQRKASKSDPLGYQHTCAGTIVNKNWILSAAHCFIDKETGKRYPIGLYSIVVGTNILGNCKSRIGVQRHCSRHKVRRAIVHKRYSLVTRENDIALVKLSTPINFKKVRAGTISIATKTPRYGTKHIITGWGSIGPKTRYVNALRKAISPIVNPKYCTRLGMKLYKGQICAGSGRGQDTCKGDSGGPLMYRKKKRYVQTGIVSFGPAVCGTEDSIKNRGAYTSVSYFRKWIRKNMK
ncbi:hypothetical protein ABK040_012051 [Willaertia magna]